MRSKVERPPDVTHFLYKFQVNASNYNKNEYIYDLITTLQLMYIIFPIPFGIQDIF